MKMVNDMSKIKKCTFIGGVSTVMLLALPTYALEFPGLIQAEDSTSRVGTSTETTSDVGGGLNVGRINPGNSLSYSVDVETCLLYTSPSPRDQRGSRMPSSA